jgi:hypothetical protein
MAKCPATELSLEYLRSRGMLAEVVERRIPMKPFPKTKDLFDFVDIVAVKQMNDLRWGCNAQGVYFVQTTGATNKSGRLSKMAIAEIAEKIEQVQYVGTIELHLWKKVGRAYEVEVLQITAEYSFGKWVITAEKGVWPTMASLRADKRLAAMPRKKK